MMKKEWLHCKKILCIRPDNLGDVIMSGPAMRALKETLNCSITLLTSSMAEGICRFMPEIDDTILFNAPWVKTENASADTAFYAIVNEVKQRNFDAAIIFNVYSQNPLPTAMIPYLAGVPLRLAYCRENPYGLLTDWIPDDEPYTLIRHQVERDLHLVATVGAHTQRERLALSFDAERWYGLSRTLQRQGIDPNVPWLIMHPGVSEQKRAYPTDGWVNAARQIRNKLGYQILVTGTASEKGLAVAISEGAGRGVYSLAGDLSLEEFILLISKAPVVVSVNTATIHIAAAVDTPLVVLYALSNPQHTPWMAKGFLLCYDVPQHLQSKNEVIRFVSESMQADADNTVSTAQILEAVGDVLHGHVAPFPTLAVPVFQ